MRSPQDIPLQIMLMASVARLRRKPPASTPILSKPFLGASLVGSLETSLGAELTVVSARHDGMPIALVAIERGDAERATAGAVVTVWHGGEIGGVGYGLITPADMAA